MFDEIKWSDWHKQQVAAILATKAANPGLTISHHIDFGIRVFHPSWPALLCEVLRDDGNRALMVDSVDASGEALIEIKVFPDWTPKIGVGGLYLKATPQKSRYKPSWFDRVTGRAGKSPGKNGRPRT
jgi:hypothetical protein